MRAPPPLLALCCLGLTGCGGNQLAQAWQLDRLRILGVRAEPAEPRPGEQVTFEALYYLPDGTTLSLATWFACLPDAADSFGCTVDPTIMDELSGIDIESLSPEELSALYARLVEAGLVGVDPWFAPTWTAPADALDDLDEQARLEGVSAVVTITAIPEGSTSDSDVEIALKRLPISEASTPNHNPEVTGFLVDERAVALGATVEVLWGQPLHVEPLLSTDSIETYLYRTEDGTDEERLEEPYATWYTEAGEFDQPYGLYPTMDVEWTPPAPTAEAGFPPYDSEQEREVDVVVVVRDRRGGMAWGQLTLRLVPATGPSLARVAD
ncbi:hypothetical protein L6R53_24850 [Myxococcota bacterium]|nr:hypothetical protein [Myxococcota bacterium]